MQGMMLGGRLFVLAPLADTIDGSDGSALPGYDRRLLWPTPRSMPDSQMLCSSFGSLLTAAFSRNFRDWRVGQDIRRDFGYVNPEFLEWLMAYPRHWTEASCAETICWGTPSVPHKPCLLSELWPGWVRIPQRSTPPAEETYPDLTRLLLSLATSKSKLKTD